MNGSSVTLDKVSIQIEASAKNATSNIEQLTRTLSELRSAVKGGFNNLSKLAQSLEQLKSASKGLKTVSNNIQSMNDVSDALKNLSSISNPKGLEKTITNLEKLPSVFNNIDAKSLSNVARVSRSLSEALSPLANKLADISNGFSAVSQLADRYGVSVTKIRTYTKQATNHTKDYFRVLDSIKSGLKTVQKQNESFFKSLSKNTSSIASKIKQIGLSLLGTRTIFTATRKAVSEYMQMDAELTWYITNNWRALGAQLAPAIEYVAYLFKQFVRVIYSVILALTGIDLIARANAKAMEGWGRAAKSTLGNLQKFDDLNVVEFPKGSGNDDNKLIELDTIDLSPIQKVIDWVRKLRDEIKEAWNSGQWYGVGEVLAEGLNGALRAIDFDWIEEKFKNVANKFGDFFQGVIDNFDWELFGAKLSRQLSLIPRMITTFINTIPWEDIGKGINIALQSFDMSFFVDSVIDPIISLIDGLQKAMLQIDSKTIAKKIGDGITSVFKNIDKLLDTIEWEKLGIKIQETILNIPWEQIFSSIVGSLMKTIGGIGDFLDGLFGTTLFGQIADDINAIIQDILEIGTTTLETLGEGSTAGKIFKNIEDIFKSISGFARDIADTITKWVVSDEFQSIVKTLEDLFGHILEHISETIKSFKDWWNGEGGTAIREILSSVSSLAQKLLPIVKTVLDLLFDDLKKTWDGFIKPILDRLLKAIKLILDLLGDIIDFIVHVFQGNWKAAFEDIKRATSRVWDYMKDGFKKMVNGWIMFFETAINGIIDKLNWLPTKINNLLGSDMLKELGINFKVNTIGHIAIPKLDTGTNDIPEDGPYYLHKHESVVPKKYNPAFGGGTNEDTNRRLDTLIDILENMDMTTIVNLGNERLYSAQQRYNRRQNDKYGTDVNL